MAQKIRRNVFETNSSSTHSISISMDSEGLVDNTLIPNDEGIVILESIEFGWEQRTYTQASVKASYMWIYVRDWCGDRTDEFFDILKNLIKEQTGCEDVIMDDDDEGYIDHQSVEDNDYHYLFEDADDNYNLLRNFIFNKYSVLETDNDND